MNRLSAQRLTPSWVYHGEGPCWSPEWGGLAWVDMLAGDILTFGRDEQPRRQHVGTVAACVRPRSSRWKACEWASTAPGTSTSYASSVGPGAASAWMPVSMPATVPSLSLDVEFWLVNLVVGVLLVAALVLLLDRTSLGRQIRASADNDLGALLSGIPVVRLHYLVFVIEGLLAGIGGVLLVYTIGLSYGSGIQLTLTAFGAAIIFGLRGPLHGFLGGLVIGVAQGLVGGLTDGGFWSALPFIFVLAVLLLSPRAVAVERP